jgi:CheY-like chemotaxis protein
MPIMGGFEATQMIRERERDTVARTRIVAMTAHAMSGDRERCLAIGMDGYVSKPVNQALLFEVVEQGSTGALAAAASQPVVFNREELLDRLGGDTDLLNDVVRLFLEDCPERLIAIKAAVDGRDAELVRTTAHALKGAAGTIAATALYGAARTLERLGSEGRLEPAEAAWRVLSKEAASLMDEFREMEAATQAQVGVACAR